MAGKEDSGCLFVFLEVSARKPGQLVCVSTHVPVCPGGGAGGNWAREGSHSWKSALLAVLFSPATV